MRINLQMPRTSLPEHSEPAPGQMSSRKPATGGFAALRRWLIHPATSVMLLALLALGISRLPAWTPLTQSTAARLLGDATGTARPTWFMPSHEFVVVQDGTDFRIFDMAEESWSELAADFAERPQDVSVFTLRQRQYRSGTWMLTHQVQSTSLETHGPQEPFHIDIPALSRRKEALLAFLLQNQHVRPDQALSLRSGHAREVRILWDGVAESAAVLLVAIAWAVSMGWVLPRWWRARRRQRALAAGCCPACGYPATNLKTPVCPECGMQRSDTCC